MLALRAFTVTVKQKTYVVTAPSIEEAEALAGQLVSDGTLPRSGRKVVQ